MSSSHGRQSGAAEPVSVQHDDRGLAALEQRLLARPAVVVARRRGLLALDRGLCDGDRVARLLDLAGEELAEDDDADDQQDRELDGGDGGGDERRVAPGLLCREVGKMIHGAD